jgi:hypothetical protein
MTRKTYYDEVDQALVNKLVSKYVRRGYRVVSQTPTSAQLVMEKKFSCLIATFLFLFFALPFFIYLFWYMGKKELSLFIRLEELNGEPIIRITNHRGKEWLYIKRQPGPKTLKTSNFLPILIRIIIAIFVIAILLLVIGLLTS